MNTTQQRVIKVLERMITLAADSEDDAELFSDHLDAMCDDIHSEDGFGTDGSTDPRGDFRDGDWNMGYVQGVDA